MTSNNYYGKDWLGIPDRWRVHTDNSLELKYLDHPKASLDKAAFSVTVDAGCESGHGVSCGLSNTDMTTSDSISPHQGFFGFMGYNRLWFNHDRLGITLGGGYMTNPGRYLVLMPPINGATAFSGTPYFTENPGDPFKAWDASATVDIMPDEFVTFRAELDYRHSSVAYFAGQGGVTPVGGNSGSAGLGRRQFQAGPSPAGNASQLFAFAGEILMRRASPPLISMLCGVATLLSGCHGDSVRWRASLAAAEVQRFQGTWQIQIVSDRSNASAEGSAAAGTIALTLNQAGLDADGLGARPHFFGTYDVDFSSFRFKPGVASGVPTVIALVAGDSIALMLGPSSSLPIELHGMIRGDSVVGRWAATERSGPGAVGDFTLRRH